MPVQVYKKLTPSDQSQVPFNAQKHYLVETSESAASASINFFYANYTSESYSLYSTSSDLFSSTGSDIINTFKYNQIDHLFYRSYKRGGSALEDYEDHFQYSLGGKNIDGNRFGGEGNFLKQKRVLYNKAGIVSLPAGYYGHAVKKGSFILSGSRSLNTGEPATIIDDSEGNLIISGTILDDYVTDIRKNVLNIGPVKGFKRYDLGVYEGYIRIDGYLQMKEDGSTHTTPGTFWRRGERMTYPPKYYNSFEYIDEYDDSYYFNSLKYKNVTFKEEILFNPNGLSATTEEYVDKFPSIHFHGGPPPAIATSSIIIPNNEKFNFNKGDDFTISFWFRNDAHGLMGPNEYPYIIGKSTTKTVSAPITTETGEEVTTMASGAFQPFDTIAEPQYPFEIYLGLGGPSNNVPHVYFSRHDGEIETLHSASVSNMLETPNMQHVACRVSSSEMSIFINGLKANPTDGTGTFGEDLSGKMTQNNANVYIGTKGGQPFPNWYNTHFSGSLSQINIHNNDLSDTQILNMYSSSNGSPYVGNMFYPHGLAVITHPGYLSGSNVSHSFIDLNRLEFEGNHLIYEHEYQCTVEDYEFNYTSNLTTRKIQTRDTEELANFATGSNFKPYVTTIGLYNEANELLVVGKLASPIRMSDETDTTFIVRYDT